MYKRLMTGILCASLMAIQSVAVAKAPLAPKEPVVSDILRTLAMVDHEEEIAYRTKIAYVDMDAVFSVAAVNDQMERLKVEFEGRRESFEKEQHKLENLISEHEKNAAMMTEKVRENRKLELQEMSQKLSQEGSAMTQEFYMKQQEIRTSFLKKATDAAEKIAKKRGITLILPKQVVLYGEEGLDISKELISELR